MDFLWSAARILCLMTSLTPMALLIGSSASVGSWIERLRTEGYQYAGPYDDGEGLAALGAVSPSVVLVTRSAWDVAGLRLIEDVKRSFLGPLITISARGCQNAAIACLDSGACDYLVEPLDANELVARIRSKARRHACGLIDHKTIEWRGLRIDLHAQKVTFMEKPIDLTRTEYKILEILIKFPGGPTPYSIFLQELWSDLNPHAMQYLRIYILNIRKKLSQAGFIERLIVSKPKYGYALNIEAS